MPRLGSWRVLTCGVWGGAEAALVHGPQLHPLPLVLPLLPLTQTQSFCPSAPQTAHTCVQLGAQERGLCSGLYHCGRRFFMLLAVINSCILSLHPADFQGEICPWPNASVPVWHPRRLVGSIKYQELWRLSWFLLVPTQIFVSITTLEALSGPAGDRGRLSRADWQGEWSLGQHGGQHWILK